MVISTFWCFVEFVGTFDTFLFLYLYLLVLLVLCGIYWNCYLLVLIIYDEI